MKFLAWFCGILVLLITPVMIFFYNFKQVAFSPEATKKIFLEIDFYNQAKSEIKKTMLEVGDNTEEMKLISKITRETLDEYNFRPKVEKAVDDFYAGLANHDGNFKITIDLIDIKGLMIQNALAENKNLPAGFSDLLIPDQWQVDFAKSNPQAIKIIAFFYNNFTWILVSYGALILLFLFFCILSGVRYMKLFFAIFLISGFLIFLQRAAWWVINPQAIFSTIIDQGNSGLQLLMENLIVYFRQQTTILLIWESAVMVGISLIGLITFAVISQNKVSNIPLNDQKNS